MMKNLNYLLFFLFLSFLLQACSMDAAVEAPNVQFENEITKQITDQRQHVFVDLTQEFGVVQPTTVRIETEPKYGKAYFHDHYLVYVPSKTFEPGHAESVYFSVSAVGMPTKIYAVNVVWPMLFSTDNCTAGLQPDIFEVPINQLSILKPLDNDPSCYKKSAHPLNIALPPLYGIVSIQADGSIVYTPQEGFIGTDRLVYQQRSNEGKVAYANIMIVVGAALPCTDNFALNPDEYEPLLVGSLPSKPVFAIDVLANDVLCRSEIEWQSFRISKTPEYGSVKIDEQTQKVLYTPAATLTKPDVFEYTLVNNRGEERFASVAVLPSVLPPCVSVAFHDSYNIKKDSGLASFGFSVVRNDSICKDKNYELFILKEPVSGTTSIASYPSFTETQIFYRISGPTAAKTDSLVYVIREVGKVESETSATVYIEFQD